MVVPPHPHTGLQTVSWLFEGEIEHRDSVGSHAMVQPGVLNLMTAGRGISHSEVSTSNTTVLHGVQLWLALPDASREVEPFFESHAAVATEHQGARFQVFFGTVAGVTATATAFTRLIAAQIDIPADHRIELEVDDRDELGLLVDQGAVTIDGTAVARTELAFLEPGASSIVIETAEAPARVVLIGGEPFGEQIVMWWNFVGRSHDEIAAYRAAWQAEASTRAVWMRGPRDSHRCTATTATRGRRCRPRSCRTCACALASADAPHVVTPVTTSTPRARRI
jgi:redox-sensitive bicupin YhaK (pirin superfamily)